MSKQPAAGDPDALPRLEWAEFRLGCRRPSRISGCGPFISPERHEFQEKLLLVISAAMR
jgi:hypothetical protein